MRPIIAGSFQFVRDSQGTDAAAVDSVTLLSLPFVIPAQAGIYEPSVFQHKGLEIVQQKVSFAFFSRKGFSEAATDYALTQNMTLIDLEKLESDLCPQN
ncbi:MAG: hypothetical protein AAF633_04295 [Chloroflexota bacterium]